MRVNVGVITDIEGALDTIEQLISGIQDDLAELRGELKTAEGERDAANERIAELEAE